MITKDVELLLNLARKEASKRKSEYVLVEHLIYVLCTSKYGTELLINCGANINQIIHDIDDYLKANIEENLTAGQTPSPSKMVDRTITRAIEHTFASEKEACDIADVLISLMEEKESYAVFLLEHEGISRLKLMKQLSVLPENRIQELLDEPYSTLNEEAESTNKISLKSNQEQRKKNKTNQEQKIIQQFFIDLRKKAIESKIDSIVGRTKELKQILNVLARRKKNNIILVGDPGVGKTALVEGMVLKLVENKLHSYFKDYEVYGLDVASLISGTKFRGDFEERIKNIIKVIKNRPKSIIFIDEIHMLVGAGATNGSTIDASNLLKNILSEGDIRLIGTTTHEEYRQQIQPNMGFSRRFEKIKITETSYSETVEILNRIKPYYENYHHVIFPEETINKFPEWSKRYFPDKNLPDGAIDIMDTAGAHLKLKKDPKYKSIVTEKEAEKIIFELTGIPIKKIERNNKTQFQNLERNLKKEIFGQPNAIDTMVRAIKLAKSGLLEENKTMGAFLFTGPTGVGKTELCKVICKHLNIHLIRLDMSEYQEAHSSSKLIGPPPGYVGFNEKSGELTEQVRQHPYSLILLDEIEKAHRDVLNLFLQIMDNGKIKNSNGRKINCEHTIIVMTSNLGAQEMSANTLGFASDTNTETPNDKPIKDFFAPEFRNRLTKVVNFNFLNQTMIKKIIARLIKELNILLTDKQVEVVLKDSAMTYLIQKGFDLKMGARPIKRTIDKEIKERLLDDLLFGKLHQGGKAVFSLDTNSPEETLNLKIEETETT